MARLFVSRFRWPWMTVRRHEREMADQRTYYAAVLCDFQLDVERHLKGDARWTLVLEDLSKVYHLSPEKTE